MRVVIYLVDVVPTTIPIFNLVLAIQSLESPLAFPWVVMLVSSLTLATLAGVAVASPTLRRNNLTEAPSVNLGYEVHTGTTNVRRIPVPGKCMAISADLLGSRLEATTSSPTSHTPSSLPVTYGSTPLAFRRGTALMLTPA